jgi:signal transduction histidine kinase/ActR/RegA family two-component response regulator
MSDSTPASSDPEQALVAAEPSETPIVLEPHPIVPRAKGRRTVVARFTLLVGLTLALLVGAMVVANGLFWQSVIRKTMDQHLSGLAASRRDMVRAQVMQMRQRVELNTDRGELRGFLWERANGQVSTENRTWAQQTLDRLAGEKPVLAASLADTSGHIVLASGHGLPVGRDVSNYLSFRSGLAGPYVGVPQKKDKKRSVAWLTAPIPDRDDAQRPHGVLFVLADVTELEKALRNTTGLGDTGDAILGAREKEQMRVFFPPRNTPEATTIPMNSLPALKDAIEGRTTLFKGADFRGVPVIAAGVPIGFGNWGLVVKMDQKEAYLPILRVVQLEILAGVIVTLLGLGAAYVLARRFAHPVRRLAQAASRIAEGDYQTAVPVGSSDEFGVLSANFNEMTAAIRSRRAERDRAEEALREADRRKDEFLAMLGHELRNPLSAIANAVRLWNVAGEDRSATELARGVIERQTGNLARLVDDLLDVARITAGKIELRRHPVEVNEIIRRAIDAVRPYAEDRRHELFLALEESTRLCVDADPTRLEQIVTNLLTNAIKYTRKGGEIRVESRADGCDAVITITDNGIGIAPRMLPRLFELFAQADRSLDRTTGGLGIGLNLCKHLAEMHGGSIAAASEGVGRGSTFTVRLPAITVPEPVMLPSQPAEPIPPHRQRRILLVDDNQDTVHSLARLLSLRGHQVATAYDGVAALKLAQEFQPDFLLLDIGLPGLDGYELARRLRAAGFEHTPIVAISGYAQEGDRTRSREAGFNYHFAKPVDFEALAELLLEDPIQEEEERKNSNQ